MERDSLGNNLNISDIIEVIQMDPDFQDGEPLYGGGGGGTNMEDTRKRSAHVKILEQPASKALRFRYECEGRSAGSIPGVNSTPENKTFPSIQVVGYKGRAVVVVSCVTKDPPYRSHPHNLVGKEGCKKGVCTVEINTDSMAVSFSNLGIQCVKKKDIEEALRVRKEIRVDPFRNGFTHGDQPTTIDLNAVRLCFQVFLEGNEKGKFTFQLPPVVSEPIYDKKAMSDLVICRLSDCSCTVAGGKEIILLCEKVAKEDIQVRFYEERDGHMVWEGFADFQPTHVHKQVAITFRTPHYRTIEVDAPVKAFVQLRRPSDGATSEPLPFEFLPLDSDPSKKRKRAKFVPDVNTNMLHDLEPTSSGMHLGRFNSPQLGHNLLQVKMEPPDPKTQYTHQRQMYGGVLATTPSPNPSPSPQSHGRTPSPMDYTPAPAHAFYHPTAGMVMYRHTDFMGMGEVFQSPQVPAEGMVGAVNGKFFPTNPLVMFNPQRVLNPARRMPQTDMDIPGQGSTWGPVASSSSPAISGFLEHSSMNIPPPVVSSVAGSVNPGEGSILDLDSHQYSLGQLDSAELANLSLFDGNLSENLSSNLPSENPPPELKQEQTTQQQQQQNDVQQENMTDSFTRLTTTTLEDICKLNSMYKGGRDG